MTFLGTTSDRNQVIAVSKQYTRASDVNGAQYFSAPHGFGYKCDGDVTLGSAQEVESISVIFSDVLLQPYNLDGSEVAPAPGRSKSPQTKFVGDHSRLSPPRLRSIRIHSRISPSAQVRWTRAARRARPRTMAMRLATLRLVSGCWSGWPSFLWRSSFTSGATGALMSV